jgi:septal ring factor EnvC (AmiA/AmiB activator)
MVFGWFTPAHSASVVIDRDEFVNVLGGVEYLQKRIDNLNEQITVLEQSVQLQKDKATDLLEQINDMELRNEALKNINSILKEDNDRLQKQLESKSSWSNFKTYGLVILSAVVAGFVLAR